jgi:hypothetical protein
VHMCKCSAVSPPKTQHENFEKTVSSMDRTEVDKDKDAVAKGAI